MGLDAELDFNKYCKVSRSPTTVLLSPRCCSKVEKRNTKGKPTCRNDLLSLMEDFTEIHFLSSSCKSVPSRTSEREGNEVLKRGSLYQSSKQVGKMKKIGAGEGRRKIELSQSSASSISFGIVDSLCGSDENSSLVGYKKSTLMSLNSTLNTTSVSKAYLEPCSQDFLDLSSHHCREGVVSSNGFLEISLNLNNRENHSAENIETLEDFKFRSDPVVGPLNDGNVLQERDTALTSQNSISAKLALPHSPSQVEIDCSRASSPKSRFGPITKMFDSFTKSKFQRSYLGSANRSGEHAAAGLASITRNKIFQKSLLHDFSSTSQSSEFVSQIVNKDPHNSAVACSLAHLHGCLKLENKHGVPFFEFTLKFPEDVFVAKTWKADNTLNWAYTFHSVQNRRKSNASGWGLKDSKEDSSMVGQMQVSCYLCTELKDAGELDNSMVTEFVLYDIAHARKSIAAQENSNHSPDVVKHCKGSNESSIGPTCKLDEVSNQLKLKLQPKDVHDNGHFDSSTPHPWMPADLHPNLEIAATVIQVPFENGERLKYKGEDAKSTQVHPNLLDLSAVEQRKKGIPDCLSPAKVSVITPSGNHSLPSSKNCGPSPLLDRWRLGGGCDCGGWDMACPLLVFGNPNSQSADDHPLMEIQQPFELFVQGSKERTPALTITIIEDGLFAVDFHAQLSTLQAFSICVAILHSTEVSIGVGLERDKQLLQCNSLKVLIEEEVKYLIGAVTEEEKKKVSRKEEIPPSFLLNPPFSPIGRV